MKMRHLAMAVATVCCASAAQASWVIDDFSVGYDDTAEMLVVHAGESITLDSVDLGNGVSRTLTLDATNDDTSVVPDETVEAYIEFGTFHDIPAYEEEYNLYYDFNMSVGFIQLDYTFDEGTIDLTQYGSSVVLETFCNDKNDSTEDKGVQFNLTLTDSYGETATTSVNPDHGAGDMMYSYIDFEAFDGSDTFDFEEVSLYSIVITGGKTGTATSTHGELFATTIPEPISLSLFGFGLIGVGAWQRKRKA